MKLLLIDAVMYGHHKTYFEALMDGLEAEHQVIGVVPDGYENPRYRLIHATLYRENMSAKDMHAIAYLEWMYRIGKIIKEEKPDIVHFLYGDIMYRYFGAGLRFCGKAKTVVTFHQVRRSRVRDISIKRICRQITQGVLHTDKLVNDLNELGIKNIQKIEYPCFGQKCDCSQAEAQKELGLDTKQCPVLLALGGTRYDKGLDILLDALDVVQTPFYLLVAGYPETYDEAYIAEHIKPYKERVTCILKYLSDEEFALCIAAADLIVLPYRKSFDGASGPLGEGVAKDKIIVGADHGSLGQTIRENHLGYVFKSENKDELADAIEYALSKPFVRDSEYRAYQKKISPHTFIENYQTLYRGISK